MAEKREPLLQGGGSPAKLFGRWSAAKAAQALLSQLSGEKSEA